MSRSTKDYLLGLVRSFSHAEHFFLLTVLPIFSFLLSVLSLARSPRRSYRSTFRVTPRMPFRHFSRARVLLKPQHCKRAPRWVPIVCTKDRVTGLNPTWAHNLFVWWVWVSYFRSFYILRLNEITFLSFSMFLFLRLSFSPQNSIPLSSL